MQELLKYLDKLMELILVIVLNIILKKYLFILIYLKLISGQKNLSTKQILFFHHHL